MEIGDGGFRSIAPPSTGKIEEAVPREVERRLHQTIQAVGNDLQAFAFNTQLARLMELTNAIYSWVGSDLKGVTKSAAKVETIETLIKLIAPSAPHLAEELWHQFGHQTTVFDAAWPEYDAEKAKADTVTIAVQINGKLRDTFEAAARATKDELEKSALELEKVKAQLEGKELVKVIVVAGKIVNLVSEAVEAELPLRVWRPTTATSGGYAKGRGNPGLLIQS